MDISAIEDPNYRELLSSKDRDIERLSRELALITQRFETGYAVDFKDFSYIPLTRQLDSSPGGLAVFDKIAPELDNILSRVEKYCSFNDNFRQIPTLREHVKSETEPYWENWWMPGLDACFLYGMIVTERPKVYFEIGSGNSTKYARRAIQDHGLDTKIISVDPHPMADIDQLCDRVIRKRCEDVDISVYAEELSEGGILFIDNSHRSFQNSDVTVFFSDILPAIPSGVIYGLHDIFIPWDYPETWNNRYYNEQYLLLSYLIGGGRGDKIFMPSHFVYKDSRFRKYLNNMFVGTRHIDWLTSSFWLKRG